MATFRTSAILELVDRTQRGASSAIRNFRNLQDSAGDFTRSVRSGVRDSVRSFQEFQFNTRAAERRLEDLRRQLREGRGDFSELRREIDRTNDELDELNRRNRFSNIANRGGRAARRVGVLGGVAGLAAGAAGITSTFGFADAADEAVKLADRVGFAVESLTALRFAVGQTAGDEGVRVLPAALAAFNRRIAELRQGRGELINLDKDLQNLLLNADGTEDAFVKFIAAVRSIEGVDNQTNVLDKAFSEAGRKLVNFARTGGDEIARLTAKAQELGIVISDVDARRAEEFVDTFDDVRQSLLGASFIVGSRLIGPFKEFAEEVLIPSILRFQDEIRNISSEDLERNFRNILEFVKETAETLIRAVRAVGDFAENVSPIIDAVTTSQAEELGDLARNTRTIPARASDAEAEEFGRELQRRAQRAGVDFNIERGFTRGREFRERLEELRALEEQTRLQQENNEILRQLVNLNTGPSIAPAQNFLLPTVPANIGEDTVLMTNGR